MNLMDKFRINKIISIETLGNQEIIVCRLKQHLYNDLQILASCACPSFLHKISKNNESREYIRTKNYQNCIFNYLLKTFEHTLRGRCQF